jgi:hypothetical protein
MTMRIARICALMLALPGMASCTGTIGPGPVPIAPGTFYMSIALSQSLGADAARQQAETRADRYCGRNGGAILDAQTVPGSEAGSSSLDVVFRCGESAAAR